MTQLKNDSTWIWPQAYPTPKTMVLSTRVQSLFAISTSVRQPGRGSDTYVLSDIILRTIGIQGVENVKETQDSVWKKSLGGCSPIPDVLLPGSGQLLESDSYTPRISPARQSCCPQRDTHS